MLYLGTLQAGAVFLPLNTAYTPAELDYFLHDAEPRVVVCDPASVAAVSALAGAARVETLDARGQGTLHDRAEAASDTFVTVARAADDLAAILYTSGTTGRSKGAMLTHDNLVSNALALCDIWRITAADRLVHALPTYHTHGLFVGVQHDIGRRRQHDLHAEIRRSRHHRGVAECHDDDGGANILYTPSRFA